MYLVNPYKIYSLNVNCYTQKSKGPSTSSRQQAAAAGSGGGAAEAVHIHAAPHFIFLNFEGLA